MIPTDSINAAVLKHYPDVQAIYLFGSYAVNDAWPDSDVDIALLLPHETSQACGCLLMSDLCIELESSLGREVDLINLRQVSTVLQKEVIMAEGRICQGDEYAADEFEMLTLSYYQKLNEERREILEEIQASGKILEL